MAVVSISRIQHRRGVLQDLPPSLNEAELGWCLDTRQLFIGNGNTYTGNSEILTQWSPNDQIITHTYVGGSPVTANTAVAGSPTVRTLGSILDDYLNVKDYGAVGDGFTDDTAAIQAAISDEWARVANLPYSPYLSRNTIYFPAGTYLISSPIALYPYTTLAGEGVNRTQIMLAAGATGPVLRTADSQGQTGASIGTNGAVLPTSITVRGFSLDASADGGNPVVLLQRCSGVTISGSKLVNAWTSGSGPQPGQDGIVIESLGTAVVTSDIYIVGASIRDCSTCIRVADPVERIYVLDGNLYDSYEGIDAGTGVDGSVDGVWIRGNSFRSLDGSAIIADTVGSVSSIANSFAYISGSAISWSAVCTLCQSMGDIFVPGTVSAQVTNGNPGYNLVFDVQQTELVTNQPVPRQEQILAAQSLSPSNIQFDISPYATSFTVFLDYSLNLDGYRKAGRLTITSDCTTAAISDSATELNALESVVFSVVIVPNDNITVWYTSTGTTDGSMSYIQTIWGT